MAFCLVGLRLMDRRGGILCNGARFAPRCRGHRALLRARQLRLVGKIRPRNVDPKYGVTSSPRVVDAGQPVPKGGGTYRVGKPYTIAGRTYTPEDKRGLHAPRAWPPGTATISTAA